MRKDRRGIALVDDLILVAIVGLVLYGASPSSVPGKGRKWEFWKKNPIEQVQKSQAQLEAEKAARDKAIADAVAKVNAENAKQLVSAHEGSEATVAAVDAAQKKAATGTVPTKELETAEKTAKLTRDSLDEATGSRVAPARVRELEQMVSNLNAGIAAGADALKSMQGALDASVAREKVLDAKVIEVTTAADAKVNAAQTKLDANEKKLVTFATERDAIATQYERIKYGAFIVVGGLILLWIASWALPLLGKAFPSVAPVADVFGKVWAPGLQMAHNAATSLNKDFVGMTEWLKSELAKRTTPDEMAALKKKISEDWMTVKDGSAQTVDRLKQELRV